MSLASAQNVAEVEHLISFQRETSVGRRCRVISTFGVLAGVTAVIVTVALVLFIGGASRSRRPSSLEEFRITVVPLERPQWFVNALNSRNVTGLDGGVSQPWGKSGSLWVFGDTIMNCSACGWGWRMVNNAGLVIELNGTRVVRAAFPNDGQGWIPQMIPKEENRSSGSEDEGSIWSGGWTAPDGTLWQAWQALKDWSGTANGLGYVNISWEATADAPMINLTRIRPDTPSAVGWWPNGPVVEKKHGDVDVLLVRDHKDGSRDVVLGYTTVANVRAGLREPIRFNQSSEPLFSLPGPDVSLLWHRKLGYVALVANWFDGELLVRTAPQPSGPWSDPYLLLKGINGNPYSANWHASLSNHSSLLLTYCGVQDDYNLYFVRVNIEDP